MTSNIKKFAAIALATTTPLLVAAGVSAGSSASVSTNPHVGDPSVWGPADAVLCNDPFAASIAGYNVIIGDNNPNVITGTPGPDAIYSLGGNDTVRGGGGPDLICLGQGHDDGLGQNGNDSVFGDTHNDDLWGNAGRDYLDGGSQTDQCDGGTSADAAANCETTVAVP